MINPLNTAKTTPLKGRGLDRGIDTLEARRERKEERKSQGELPAQRVRRFLEKLLTRSATALIYVLINVVALFLGPLSFALLVTLESWLCCSELFSLWSSTEMEPFEPLGLAVAVALPLATYFGNTYGYIATVLCFLVLLGFWYIGSPRKQLRDIFATFFAVSYTAGMLSALILIRMSDLTLNGALLVALVMLSVWLNDTCAYLVGCTIGRHKLAPSISPNKSIEGFLAGLCASILVWLCAAWFQILKVPFSYALLGGLLIGLVAVLGDLFESRLKRDVNAKDSSQLLPGHGGMLDRLDSILFAGVVSLMLLTLWNVV